MRTGHKAVHNRARRKGRRRREHGRRARTEARLRKRAERRLAELGAPITV